MTRTEIEQPTGETQMTRTEIEQPTGETQMKRNQNTERQQMTVSTYFSVEGLGRQRFEGSTLADLSAAWCAFRDEHGFGGSAVRSGGVVMGPEGECAFVSYNGKVWSNSEAWKSEAPLFNPYS